MRLCPVLEDWDSCLDKAVALLVQLGAVGVNMEHRGGQKGKARNTVI